MPVVVERHDRLVAGITLHQLRIIEWRCRVGDVMLDFVEVGSLDDQFLLFGNRSGKRSRASHCQRQQTHYDKE